MKGRKRKNPSTTCVGVSSRTRARKAVSAGNEPARETTVVSLSVDSESDDICGKKQSGEFLEGIAPDAVMGLGPGEISDPGRIYFGDVRPSTQQSTRFIPYNNDFVAYFVGVEACCVGNSCLKQSSFKTLIDSGQSFLREEIYRGVAVEIDSHVNATVKKLEGAPWEYCYETSAEPKVPATKLKFSSNNTFVIHKPLFVLQRSDVRSFPWNYMAGYRIVFDRENMKLGWSRVHHQIHCQQRSSKAEAMRFHRQLQVKLLPKHHRPQHH
ncbi:hypothetical protein DY000_02019379 [Brassica cretica]|uniref:Xylanase inhibitor C-terminal domain-containing protein n=1 Tax=Brassica cretica TaxID=69181 RepID=A0ABQ7D8F0_BRACR|nr:hypothetical protein DY000_02019379 [Brassica cretica]